MGSGEGGLDAPGGLSPSFKGGWKALITACDGESTCSHCEVKTRNTQESASVH